MGLFVFVACGCALVTAFAQGAAAAQRVARIEIRHVGPPAASDRFVLDHIKTRVGDPYQLPAVDEDIRALYATGYFYNIRVSEERTPEGVVLTYVLQGRPTVADIKFTGNTRFSNAKLAKTVSSKVGRPLDEQKLFQDCREIQKLYQRVGYPDTTVQYKLSIDEAAGRGTVTFEIRESRKVKIVDVQFEGAQPAFQKQLRKVIKTRKAWMFSWLTGRGYLKKDEFEDDKERLTQFYLERGYLDFELKDVQFEYPKSNRLVLKFVVSEGRQYKVGSITFKGATLLPTNYLARPVATRPPETSPRQWAQIQTFLKSFKMREGDVFSPSGLEQDIRAIEEFYGAQAYVDVTEFSGNLRVRRIPNVARGTIDLEFEITEGQQTYVEKIEIRGNEKTKDRVIRRELAIFPGEPFDMSKVNLSRNRVEGLGYFSKVEVKPEPTEIAPNRKNLAITVEEKPTGFLTAGAGFSSIDRLLGFAEFTQGNFDLFNPPTFTGGGQKARAYVAVGSRRRDVVLTFIEPWFMDQRLELGTELYHRWLDFESLHDLYTETRTGARVWLRKAIWRENFTATLGYNIENVDLEFDPAYEPYLPSVFLAERGNALLSRVNLTLAYDTRNRYKLPDRGQRTELVGEVAGGPLGGDKSIYRLELRTGWYFKGLAEGHILELNGRLGVVEGYGDTESVPFYERYYLGGLYTLRGYKYRAIGPKELVIAPTGPLLEPIGGSTFWMGSVEYSIPVIPRVRFATFYDIGMVYPEAYDFTPQKFPDPATGRLISTGTYADNLGVGLRLDLPIGPLRLDLGFPLTHDPTVGDSPKFQFGVGYTRQF